MDHMQTANDEIDELIGPCPRCGKFKDRFDADLADGIVERDKRMSNDADQSVLREMINGMGYYCRACIGATIFQENKSRHEHQIRHLIYKTYSKKLIPESGKEQTFDRSSSSIEGENIDQWTRARAALPTEGTFWIYGPPGVGKTYLARCILNACLSRHRSAAEISAPDLSHIEIAGSSARLKPYIGANILLVDDIDKPRWSAVSLGYLLKIFEARYEAGLCTVVTANSGASSTKQLMASGRLDNPSVLSAIYDRMKPLVPLEISGRSHR